MTMDNEVIKLLGIALIVCAGVLALAREFVQRSGKSIPENNFPTGEEAQEPNRQPSIFISATMTTTLEVTEGMAMRLQLVFPWLPVAERREARRLIRELRDVRNSIAHGYSTGLAPYLAEDVLSDAAKFLRRLAVPDESPSVTPLQPRFRTALEHLPGELTEFAGEIIDFHEDAELDRIEGGELRWSENREFWALAFTIFKSRVLHIRFTRSKRRRRRPSTAIDAAWT
jgi:hypothetical protein